MTKKILTDVEIDGALIVDGQLIYPTPDISQVWSDWEDNASYGSGNSSIDVNAYTGVLADDVILVFGLIGGGSSNLSVSSSGLTFNLIGFSDGTSHGFKAWYAISPDATSRVISCTTSTERFLGMHVSILRNVDATSPLDVAGTAAAIGSTTTPTVPAITVPTAGAWAYAGISLLDNYSPTGPSGWVTEVVQNTSDWSAIGVAHKVMSAAGSSGDAVFGCSPAINGHGISFAVRPTTPLLGGSTGAPADDADALIAAQVFS